MSTLLEAFGWIAGILLVVVLYSRWWTGALARFCATRGYVYRWNDSEAEAAARPLVGDGRLHNFVTGSRAGRPFIFCIRSSDRLSAGSSTIARSLNVLVDLRRPVPSLRLQFVGNNLPASWKLKNASIEIPGAADFSGRYHVSGADEDAVRAVLTPGLRATCLAASPDRVVSDGRSLLCTWGEWLRSPRLVEGFINHAVGMAEQLEGGAVGVTAVETAAARPVPPPPLRKIHFGSFAAGSILGVMGGCLLAFGGVFAVAALSSVLYQGASTGLLVFLAASIGGVMAGAALLVLARRARQEKPIFALTGRQSRAHRDGLEKSARRWARMLTAQRKRGQTTYSIDPAAATLLRDMMPPESRNAALEVMLSGGTIADLGQVCRTLVEIDTGITPGNPDAHERLIRVVEQEIAAAAGSHH